MSDRYIVAKFRRLDGGIFCCIPSIIWHGKEWITVKTETGNYKFRIIDVINIEWKII